MTPMIVLPWLRMQAVNQSVGEHGSVWLVNVYTGALLSILIMKDVLFDIRMTGQVLSSWTNDTQPPESSLSCLSACSVYPLPFCIIRQ